MMDWYDLASSMQPNAPGPAQSMPMGTGMSGVNIFNMGGMSNPAWYGGGQGAQAGMLSQIMSFIGPMLGVNLNLTPTGGMFSPVGRGMMEQQQRALANAQNMIAQSSNARLGREIAAVASRITGTPIDSKDTEQYTGIINRIQNSGALPMLDQFVPGLSNWVKDLTGGSSQAALANMIGASSVQRFAGGRAFSTRRMASIMNMINDEFSGKGGKRNLDFTQGLNVEDIGGGFSAYLQNFSVDPSIMNNEDGIKKFIQDANGITASLRDLFGPNGSVSELYNNLQQMTQGGLNQMSPQEMKQFVNKIKMTSLATGITPEMMQALVAQGSMFAEQLGLPGIVGGRAVMDASLLTTSTLRTRQQGGVWGQLSTSRLAEQVTQLGMGTIAGVEANALGGLARFVETFGEQVPEQIRDLVARGKAGNLTPDQINMLRSPGMLMSVLTSVAGVDEQTASSFLTDRVQNSRFFEEMQGGINNIQGETLRRGLMNNLQGITGLSGENLEGVFEDLVANPNEEEAIAAIARRMGGGDEATNRARSAYNVFRSRLGGRVDRLDVARALLGGEHEQTKRLVAEMTRREEVLTEAGAGRGGGMLSRIAQMMVADERVGLDDVFATILGAPTGSMSKMIQDELEEAGVGLGDTERETYSKLVGAQRDKLKGIHSKVADALQEQDPEKRKVLIDEARELEEKLDKDVDFQFSRALVASFDIKDSKKRKEAIENLVGSFDAAKEAGDATKLATDGIPGLNPEKDKVDEALKLIEAMSKFLEDGVISVRIVGDRPKPEGDGDPEVE